MKSDFRVRRPAQLIGRVTFGILLFLTALALMAALSGSNSIGISNAQALLPVPGTNTDTNAEGASKRVPTTGGKIAFYATNPGVQFDIYTIDANGSNFNQLTTDPAFDGQPSWSPDGSKIAFSSTRGGSRGIWVMNANGSDQHGISSGGDEYPTWSPDGSKIAFTRALEIYLMNSNGTGTTPLTTDHTSSWQPAWSPDGTKIAFSNSMRDGDGYYEIYVMDSNGSNQHILTNPEGVHDEFPSWSPDGSKIGFTRGLTGNFAIYTMNANGSGLDQISYPPQDEMDGNPTWSPDGLKIAFQRYSSAAYSGHLYTIDADGTNEQMLPSHLQFEYDPDWQHSPTTTVLVQNEQGTPVAGAQVYTNTNGPGYPSTFVGTTSMSGTLALPNPQVNEYVIARTHVYTGTTSKAAHDGWAYHVWLTNIEQEFDGLQSAYMISNTTQMTQTVVVSRDKPLIGFNIVASVEYNATPSNLSMIAEGLSGKDRANGFYLPGATDYLLDVSDGQMFFEKVTLYEDKQHWDDADYQFFAYFPRANANARYDGRSALTGTCCHIHVQSSGHYGAAWNQPNGYSTLIHEFTHYAIGAYDEYFYRQDGEDSNCSLVVEPDYEKRASIMNDQTVASEYCTEDNHNPLTNQGVLRGESVWRTVKNNWDDNLSWWTLQSPINRGFVDPGPLGYISREAQKSVTTIVPVAAVACPAIKVSVGTFGADIILNRQGFSTNEGPTDIDGVAWVYGAEIGVDTIEASYFNGNTYRTGHADVTSCNPIDITLSASADRGQSAPASLPADTIPTYWISATANFSQTQVHPLLHFASDPSSPPILYASQGGIDRQQVALTYDPAGHNYTGDFAFDPARSLDLQFEVGLTGTQGLQVFSHNFVATQYHNFGPERIKGGKPPFAPPLVPSNWDIFPPEAAVNLSVDSNSMPDGTGVMGGDVTLPAAPLTGLLAVGGPYSIQGENPISGSVQISLEFQSEIFCGLVGGSIKVYRYNGTGWDALTTLVNEEWHAASADITEWGIYGVFAQPNPRVVFSDVPAGSTFYDYINWITCHGIASGYTDGTFRPNNNATRGQVSKMVALAYQWRLEAPQAQQKSTHGGLEPFQWQWSPSAGGYTFADVLPGSTFYLYIEAAYREGVVNGYPCGGNGEPCDSEHRPYFRPNNNVTRGQIAKIISNAALYDDTPTGQGFQDVLAGSTFYTYTQRIASRGIINGYPCGGAGEPCVPPANRPYLRPNNNATRGQLSKMIYLALQPR